jgi:hypothetical protein
MPKRPFDDDAKARLLKAMGYAATVYDLVQSFQVEIMWACRAVIMICLITLAFALFKKK